MKLSKRGDLEKESLEFTFTDWKIIGGRQASKGHNPFDDFYIDRQINYISHRSTPLDDNDVLMSAVCKAYDPPYVTSKVAYQDIKDNIEKLIEEAIEIRNRYPK